ncbi:hypothetical protein V3C99_006473 [Haemonchus contortus]
MTAVEMKTEFGYTEVGVEDLCTTSYSYGDDDDIICLDCDDVSTSSSSLVQNVQPKPEPGPSPVSRLLLQIVRLHLSEQCKSPGCMAVMEETQSLRKKMNTLEDLSTRLRRICSTQQSEIARLNEETEKHKRKISIMESVIKRQSIIIRDFECQLNVLHRTPAKPLATKQPNFPQQKVANVPQAVNHSFHNSPRPEPPVIVKRNVRSEANPPSTGDRRASFNKSPVQRVDRTPQRVNGVAKTPLRAPQAHPTLQRMPPTPTISASPQTPTNKTSSKSGRLKLEVPFAHESSLINFSSPIETPMLDYPMECQRCKIAGPKDLSLEIKTEPSNFLLTKKVQGVIKCNPIHAFPKKVRIFCYMESAVNVRRWTSSLLCNLASSERIKFEIVFSKDQQIAQFDRVVAFAYGTFGNDKYVTDRIIFNVGYQTNGVYENRQVAIAPNVAEPMETDSMTPPSPGRNGLRRELDDSNFEVYRP